MINGQKPGSENGQALMEFAFVLPILLLIIMGVIEFGWYFTSRYDLDHFSREVGYNIERPFTLVWKHETAPRDWVDAADGRKPVWLTGAEKEEWSFDEYDGWYAFSEPGAGEFIGSNYFYGALDTKTKFLSRLVTNSIILDEDRVDYQIRGGWYINAEGNHLPQGGGSPWKQMRNKPRTGYYYADITVDISYEYKPVTMVGQMFLCPPGADSVMLEKSSRYTYNMDPAWLSN